MENRRRDHADVRRGSQHPGSGARSTRRNTRTATCRAPDHGGDVYKGIPGRAALQRSRQCEPQLTFRRRRDSQRRGAAPSVPTCTRRPRKLAGTPRLPRRSSHRHDARDGLRRTRFPGLHLAKELPRHQILSVLWMRPVRALPGTAGGLLRLPDRRRRPRLQGRGTGSEPRAHPPVGLVLRRRKSLGTG